MLSVVSLILRGANVFFGAYISKNIGASGTGVYSLVGSVFAPAAALSTAGVNLAVSRLIAEEDGRGNGFSARHILRSCIGYALSVSLSVAFVLVSVSGYISESWLGCPDAANLIVTLALSLPFSAMSAAFAGYFIAVRRVSRNAAAALFEQVFRIGITVLAINRLYVRSHAACLAAVVISSAVTDGAACLLSALLCRIDLRSGGRSKRPCNLTRRVLGITVPVSASSFLRSALVALEHILIPRGLRKSGASYDAAMASYGTLSGMAMPIIMFPASFLYSFTGLMIPEFAEARGKGDTDGIRRGALSVIRTVLIFSIGASGVIFGFSHSIGMSLYGSHEAAKYVMIMAPLIPVMYLDTAVDSVLKGIGEQVWTMKVNIFDAAVSVLAVWLLVPKLALYGYIAVIFISEAVNFGFSIMRLIRVTRIKVGLFRMSVKPILSVCVSVLTVKSVFGLFSFARIPSAVTAIVGISASGLLYFLLLAVSGVVPRERISAFFGSIPKAGASDKEAEAAENRAE